VKRTPLKRNKRLDRRGSLRAMSEKRRAERDLRRSATTEAFRRDHYLCQASIIWPEVTCRGPIHAHEPLTRARGGDPLDPDEIVTLCSEHHTHVHLYPDLAYQRGLLRHSWDR
jgi:hypothetical protein